VAEHSSVEGCRLHKNILSDAIRRVRSIQNICYRT
jgi:hypothetical protein